MVYTDYQTLSLTKQLNYNLKLSVIKLDFLLQSKTEKKYCLNLYVCM